MARTTIPSGQIRDNEILNEDIASNAAIAGTKISPDFGVQNLVVDTDTLFVNSTSDQVGINTSTLTAALDVVALSGTAGEFNGFANFDTVRIFGSSTTSQSFGLNVDAGTDASDYALLVRNFNGSNNFIRIGGDGFIHVGAAATSTAAAASTLFVKGSLNAEGTIRAVDSAGSAVSQIRHDGSFAVLESSFLGAVTNAGVKLRAVSGGTGFDAVTILTDGKMGVGTASPQQLLQVGIFSGDNALTVGAGTTNAGRLIFNDAVGTQHTGGLRYAHDTDSLFFRTANSDSVTIDSSGNTTINGTLGVGESAQTTRGITTVVSAGPAATTGVVGVRATPTRTSAGNDQNFQAFYARPIVDATALTVASAEGFFADNITVTAGTLTTAYGLRIANITTGGTNYSIHTGTAQSRFGGNVGIGSETIQSDSRAVGSVSTAGSVFLGVVAGDPATPVEGQIWYNSTDKAFKGYNGTSIVLLG